MKLACTKCDRPTGIFTPGKVYEQREDGMVTDDLGHSRFIGSSLRFVIGSHGNVLHGNEEADFAYFTPEENVVPGALDVHLDGDPDRDPAFRTGAGDTQRNEQGYRT